MIKKLIRLDAQFSQRLTTLQRWDALRRCVVVLAHSGDSWFWGAGLIVMWLAGSTFWREWAVTELFWIAWLAVLVQALKFSIRRKRPAGEWGAIYREGDPHSFPSGHAARVFLIAVLATGLGPAWLAILLWIWAPLVSLARVVMSVHYLADVAAGFLVGIGLAVFGLWASPYIFATLSAWIGRPLW